MTNSKRLPVLLAAAIAVLSSAVSCSGSKSTKEKTQAATASQQSAEDVSVAADGLSGEDMEITWLSYYDLNPSGNDERSVPLAVYEDVYGGKINFVSVSRDNIFSTLDSMIQSGEEVDMFPYEVSALPNGVLSSRFEALDPYFTEMGMDDGLWDDMAEVTDALEYKGQHYVVPYSLSDTFCLTYSRKLMQSEGIDDPYTLYKDGKWDWNTFMAMMEKFVANRPDANRCGINGYFGEALFRSTGSTVAGYDGSRFTNNISTPEIERAGLFMQEIAAKGLYDKTWKGFFPSDFNTLFYASEDWTVGDSNAFNPEADLMVVPFPKAPDADSYYLNCVFNARMLVKNSAKGKAVAAYLKCERLAAAEEKYRQAAREKALKSVTEEQYNALQEYLDPAKFTPVFDFAYGMGSRMYGSGSYSFETRGVMDNLATALLEGGAPVDSWEALRNAVSGTIDEEIEKYNN